MTEPYIKREAVYGHAEDPSFETTDRGRAIAYARIYPLNGWLRQRLRDSGRFQSESRLEGQVRCDIELLLEYEMKRETPARYFDYLGMGDELPSMESEPDCTVDASGCVKVRCDPE